MAPHGLFGLVRHLRHLASVDADCRQGAPGAGADAEPWAMAVSAVRHLTPMPIRSRKGFAQAKVPGAPLAAPLLLDPIPDHRRYVRSTEILDRADAGRRGDVDLCEIAADHVDADEEQAALAQRRADARANLALARGELGRLGGAAAHHIGADV